MKQYVECASPIGRLLVVAEGKAVTEIHFPNKRVRPARDWEEGSPLLRRAAKQLEQYFAGRRKAFDLPLEPRGTEFQRAVWAELQRIDYGGTVSYGELATRIARPKAVRAVGAANGANPIPIVIPCHRVIGANGKLTGFGGGLPTKKKLLALESGAALSA